MRVDYLYLHYKWSYSLFLACYKKHSNLSSLTLYNYIVLFPWCFVISASNNLKRALIFLKNINNTLLLKLKIRICLANSRAATTNEMTTKWNISINWIAQLFRNCSFKILNIDLFYDKIFQTRQNNSIKVNFHFHKERIALRDICKKKQT